MASCPGEPRGPIPSLQEVLACQISSWYPVFAQLPTNPLRRTKVTPRTIILDKVPDDFVDYLLEDGVRLPSGCKTSNFLPASDPEQAVWSSDDEEDDHDEPVPVESVGPPSRSFPDLDRRIAAAIEELGGAVMPKLNWSAPKDAVWMNSGSMRCETPGDVYLLLQSSDFCTFDLQHALDHVRHNTDYKPSYPVQLALRKWCHLYPSQEFRCFVRGHELMAVSQRHDRQHFPHLLEDRFLLRSLLLEFFDEIVQSRFASGTVSDYVFDAYIDKSEKVWLIDFNVWGQRTDPLLFTWKELVDIDTDALPEIRIVESAKEVRANPLSSYRAPIDTVEMATAAGGMDANRFEAFMKLCERPSVLEAEHEEQQLE